MDEQRMNPLDLLIPHMLIAVQTWQEKNSPAQIEQSVHRRLDKNRDDIVLKLLGFDSNYGGHYKLDHCNGRSGESAAGRYLYEIQKEAVHAWLASTAMPKLTDEQIRVLSDSMHKEYHDLMRRRLMEAVRKKVDTDIQELMDSLGSSLTIEQHLKLLALLQ